MKNRPQLDLTGYEDKELVCQDKDHKGEDKTFIWERGEQAFIHQLDLEGKLQGEVTSPKRCKACRIRRKAEKEERERKEFEEQNG